MATISGLTARVVPPAEHFTLAAHGTLTKVHTQSPGHAADSINALQHRALERKPLLGGGENKIEVDAGKSDKNDLAETAFYDASKHALLRSFLGSVIGGTAVLAVLLPIEYVIQEKAIKNGISDGLQKKGPIQVAIQKTQQ